MPASKTRKKLVTKRLREECQCSGVTVDQQESVLRGVKILGYQSKNGRRYTTEAARQAIPMYEGCRVNIDHPDGNPNQSRRVRERFGKLENVEERADGLYGDLKFNPHHAEAKSVAWWAANAPDCLGLSHNAVGQGGSEDGVFVVEKIVNVRSVDLVADPATTKSLFEGGMGDDYLDDDELDAGADDTAGDEGAEAGHEDHLIDAVSAVLRNAEMSGPDKKKKVMEILKVLDSGKAETETDSEVEDHEDGEADDDKPGETEESVQTDDESEGEDVTEENKQLKARLDAYEAKERLEKSRRKARKLALSSGLPKELVTAIFIEQLAASPNEKTMKALIEDRRRLAGRKPRSAGPGRDVDLTEDEFKNQLLKGVA